MRIKLTILESRCRSNYHKKGDSFIVDDLCPSICHELWQGGYPYIFTLKNNGDLDMGLERKKEFTYQCPDQGRVKIKGEIFNDQ